MAQRNLGTDSCHTTCCVLRAARGALHVRHTACCARALGHAVVVALQEGGEFPRLLRQPLLVLAEVQPGVDHNDVVRLDVVQGTRAALRF